MSIAWNGISLQDLPQTVRLLGALDDLWRDSSVLAIWLGGSLASGKADQHSDVDLHIAVNPNNFDAEVIPNGAARLKAESVSCTTRKWHEDHTMYQLLLRSGELYDLHVQTTAGKPMEETRLVLACRDTEFGEQLHAPAHDIVTEFPAAQPAVIRDALVSFWVGQHKHQKVLARDLELVAWLGEGMFRGELIRLWFILETGTDCGHASRLTIHSMTPVARTIRARYGDAAMQRIGAPLRGRDEIIAQTAFLRAEVARVGRVLAAKLGFDYPEEPEAVATKSWQNLSE